MHRNAFHCPDVGKEKHGCIVIVGKKDLQDFLFARRYVLHNWRQRDLQYKMYFPHISKSWNPNIMRCVSTLYFRQIMTALHFLCIGARWRVLPLINNWCHQVLMYWFTISSTLCRTNNFLGATWSPIGLEIEIKTRLHDEAKPEQIHHQPLHYINNG